MDTQRGTVKWFSRDKGWGFIRLESGDEVFVHHSDIEGDGFVTLEDDEDVEFTVEEMEKGPRARNVRRLGQASGGSSGSSAAVGASTSASAPRERNDGMSRSAGEDARTGRRRREATSSNRSEDESTAGDRSSGGLRPLAAQLRERLGRHFPGFGG